MNIEILKSWCVYFNAWSVVGKADELRVYISSWNYDVAITETWVQGWGGDTTGSSTCQGFDVSVMIEKEVKEVEELLY